MYVHVSSVCVCVLLHLELTERLVLQGQLGQFGPTAQRPQLGGHDPSSQLVVPDELGLQQGSVPARHQRGHQQRNVGVEECLYTHTTHSASAACCGMRERLNP